MYTPHDVGLNTLPFPSSWRQITSLTIKFSGHKTDTIGADMLRVCVNLEEFIIAGHCTGLGSNGSKPVTLNHLQKLHTYCSHNKFLLSLKTPCIQDFAVKASDSDYLSDDAVPHYIKNNGSTLLKLSIAPVSFRSGFVESIPWLGSLMELKLYDNDLDANGSTMMYKILSSLVVNPEMDPSTVPLPRLESLEIICQAHEVNQRMFMKVIKSRWWSDEEERQKQGQRSLSRIKRSVLFNVHTELNMFCRDDVDDLRAEGMRIEYLAPFDGMDKDDFYTSRYYTYYPSPLDPPE